MTVWLNDLKGNWLSWLAVFVTCVVSSCGCAVAIILLMGTGDDAGALGGTILGMAVCAVVLVMWSQTRLILDEHRTVYRSWQMVGMPRWLIIVLVMGHVAAVSAAGSVVGALLAQLPLPFVHSALSMDHINAGELSLTSAAWVTSISVCVCSSVLGGLLSIRRAFRAQPPRGVAVRSVLGITAVSGAVYGMAHIPNPDDLLGACMGFVILVTLLLPWLLPVADQWTRLLGIAGANVRVRRQFSSPQVLPWVLGGGIIISIGSGLRTLMAMNGGFSSSPWQVFVVFLSPTLAPCLALALTTPLLMRTRIAADSRALTLAGAPPRMLMQVQITEALALTLTATGLIAAMTVVVVLLENHASKGQWTVDGFWWQPLVILGVTMFAGSVAAKCGVATRARHAN